MSETTQPSAQSWAPEVIADDSGKWLPNGTRYATKEEAEAHNSNLYMRWTAVKSTRVVPSADPVNCRWDREKGTVFLDATASAAE